MISIPNNVTNGHTTTLLSILEQQWDKESLEKDNRWLKVEKCFWNALTLVVAIGTVGCMYGILKVFNPLTRDMGIAMIVGGTFSGVTIGIMSNALANLTKDRIITNRARIQAVVILRTDKFADFWNKHGVDYVSEAPFEIEKLHLLIKYMHNKFKISQLEGANSPIIDDLRADNDRLLKIINEDDGSIAAIDVSKDVSGLMDYSSEPVKVTPLIDNTNLDTDIR